MDNGITYAIFGIMTLTIGAIIWMVKWLAGTLSKDLKSHTAAAVKQTASSNKLIQATQANTIASEEMITFMKNLNGKLAKATIDTIKESTALVHEAKK